LAVAVVEVILIVDVIMDQVIAEAVVVVAVDIGLQP
jgi:hypothetical protein